MCPRLNKASKDHPRFEISEHLDSDAVIAATINETLKDYDHRVFLRILGEAAKSKGVTNIADDTGLGRESLYKVFKGDGKPQFDTVFKILTAAGFHMVIKATKPTKKLAEKKDVIVKADVTKLPTTKAAKKNVILKTSKLPSVRVRTKIGAPKTETANPKRKRVATGAHPRTTHA